MAEEEKKHTWKRNGHKGGPEDEPPLFTKGPFRFSIWYFLVAMVGIMVVNSLFLKAPDQLIEFSQFKELIRNGEIVRVEMAETYFTGYSMTRTQAGEADARELQDKTKQYRTAAIDDPSFMALLDAKGVEYFATPTQNRPLLGLLVSWVVPLLLMVLVWRFLFRRMGSQGADVMSFGRNRARIVAEGETTERFADVAGADEAKWELEEVIDFLKNPDKYTAIGGKIPKGVLLVGAPGTGKTLLARATAGEASVPFFRLSGADFVEMFVGVGAARVRDLFKQAREKAPCIIFIDELDAIGKSRAQHLSSNDEREQTLNQLLVEMDGFDSRTGVIILGATNRPEILDPALMRAGRFDRQVVVDRPDLVGREAILKIHAKDVKIDTSVDLKNVAKFTAGFVGADLANLVNEAALLAVRAGRVRVVQGDFDEAVEKIVAGLQKRTKIISPKERETVAYHETGHALVAEMTPGSDPVQKITIVPRGVSALGYTLQRPGEERYLLTEEELLGKIDVLLGGRAAEELILDKISTGAANDLSRATDIANRMITEYGMSEKFRNMQLPYRKQSAFLGEENYAVQREYSESTQQYVDEETSRILERRYQAVLDKLKEKKDLLIRIARKLLDLETLDEGQFRELIATAR